MELVYREWQPCPQSVAAKAKDNHVSGGVGEKSPAAPESLGIKRQKNTLFRGVYGLLSRLKFGLSIPSR
jgi:hypothetical protein